MQTLISALGVEDEARYRIMCAKRVLNGISPALHYLHSAGFMHGDLKPGNMIYDKMFSGRITIIDFGSVMAFPREGDELPFSTATSKFFQDADRLLNPTYTAKAAADWWVILHSVSMHAYFWVTVPLSDILKNCCSSPPTCSSSFKTVAHMVMPPPSFFLRLPTARPLCRRRSQSCRAVLCRLRIS